MAIDLARSASRRQWLLLAVLGIVLGAMLYVQLRGDNPAGQAPAASNTQGRPGAAAGAQGSEALEVRLEALQAERSEPEPVERNPFRFEARRRDPEPEAAPRPAPAPPPPVESGPPETPPPPPIPLKFIGIIESPGLGRLAALSDGRHVFHGRAGDIIEGRYRIVRIGVESIVLERVDGGAPQTIRLSGQ